MAKRDTKQLIINAAIELYAKYGYKATTCEDLAKAVGIRPSALYKHFKDKREIHEVAILQLADKALMAARNGILPSAYFKEHPSLLFFALHAAMAGGDDFTTINELALEPLSAHWGIGELYALAGGIVWENAT